jgi:pimeloyl-ACP methyl ester carboxylesterase
MAGAERALADAYDVILAFDYENLNTPIEENARSLAERLDDVGLGAGHGKRFDIVAHSMGGLVSRYLIEYVGGVDVDRLVTLGTPNGGSPWPTVQKWATAGVAFAVNSLTAVAWPVQVLGSVLGLVEKVDTALDQMEPGSPFLKNLALGSDPEVPYHVIIGDRSLVEGAPAKGLLSRLWPGRVVSDVIDLAFFNHPNDLAVAVTSARSVPEGRRPAVEFHVIASDHVSFFSTPVSLRLLAELLADDAGVVR